MKKFIPIILLLSFLGLLVGANVYLSERIAFYFNLNTALPLYFVFGGITVFMIGGLISFTNTKSKLGSYAYMAASFLMGYMLYLLLSTNLIDIVHLFLNAPPIYFGLSIILLALTVSIYGIYNSFNTKVVAIDVPIKGLNRDVKAMHLTDIHIGHFRGKKFLQNIVDKTNKENVDIVFITGDLFDGKIRLSLEHLQPLKKLKAPIYFVEGNHDGYTGPQIIKQKLREVGVIVLENEVVNWGEFQIIGLNHMMADTNSMRMHTQNNVETIKSVLQNLETVDSKPSILLHHSPDGIQYANAKNVDLYLAGHTHAGQMFPINQIAKLIFAYNNGLHDYNGTKIYVSEGAGTFGPPMRIGTKSEITLITLKS